MDRNVAIIQDEDGNKLALIQDIRFKGKLYLYDILDIKKETSNSFGE